jgi:anaerobic ribonucleoside-triphosphate reductase activating protein
MEIHGTISHSQVNGPGRRAVVWFQGCTLNCKGCWNPGTHPISVGSDRSVEEVGAWILSCIDIEGVTLSGGEPFQQAAGLLGLCEFLKSQRPNLSLAVFSGYTTKELSCGRWTYRQNNDLGVQGSGLLFWQIAKHLDFGIFGRFSQSQASGDTPLCGSRNQEVVFFTDRYGAQDLQPQSCEINISADGNEMTITGFPPSELTQILLAR